MKNQQNTDKKIIDACEAELFSYGEYDYSKNADITLFNYGEDFIIEKKFENLEDCLKYKCTKGFVWINFDNIHNKKIIDVVGSNFNIHPLVVEDITEINQRPKFEEFDDYSYIVFKMLYYKNQKIISEKVSIILFKKMLITFQEVPGDIFDGIRNSLRSNKGKLRKLGVDFLAYSLINAVVDNYMIVLEKIGEQIDNLEDIIMDTTNRDIIKSIHMIKNSIIYLRKAIWPLREVLYQIDRGQSDFISDEITVYFRDINYHLIQIIDQIEIYRETLINMTDIFLSNMDHKLNNVIRRLTIITTIFMPLTVLTGVGGMSEWSMITGQDNWMISYPLFFLGMVVISIGTYLFLKFKKWI